MKRRNLFKATLAAAMLLGGAAAAETKFMTLDGFPAGTGAGQFSIAFTQLMQKHLPVEIQVSVGKPATKSAVDAASGKVDFIGLFPTVNFLMQKKLAMFANVDTAPELAGKLRGIVAYSLGPYQIVTHADAGITSLGDIKGKKVFLGPPGGAATNTMVQLVAAATGYKADEDYELMRFDWKSAETAFLDRQMAVYTIPTALPAAQIQQFAQVSPIRLLGISDETIASDGMKPVIGLPGRSIETIEPNTYDNQVNETAIKTLGTWGGLGTHEGVDADTIYEMTKVFWENIADIHATATWMEDITPDMAFAQMNVPLHAGAYRYYKEAGFDVPEALIPPEAK